MCLGLIYTFRATVIPSYAKLIVGVRHPKRVDRDLLVERVMACVRGAAEATGCTFKFEEGFAYDPLNNNMVLSDCYEEIGKDMLADQGFTVTHRVEIGSTDFVSPHYDSRLTSSFSTEADAHMLPG